MLKSLLHHRSLLFIQPAVLFHIRPFQLGIKGKAAVSISFRLNFLCFFHSFSDFCRAFSLFPVPVRQFRKGNSGCFHADIHSVQKGTADFSKIIAYLSRAAAAAVSVRIIAAAAGIAGTDQHKIRRILIASALPYQGNPSILQWLS